MRFALLAIGLLALPACKTNLTQKQVMDTTTIFGLEVAAASTGTMTPAIRFGLVRHKYFSNPTGTGTNEVHAAPFSSHVVANLSAIRQTADEDFSTLTNPPLYNYGTNYPFIQ